jgi:Putative peptidoglycan binding domain
MKLTQRIGLLIGGTAMTALTLIAAPFVHAATPTLSLSNVGGDSVQMTVSADPNASVMFYYNIGSSSGMQVTTLGTTNSSGGFSMTVSSASYSINSGSSVYVIVNGQQSSMQSWPYTAATGMPTLSQSSVTIGLGQTTTITSQGNGTAVYMISNSNPSIATVQTNGSTQITATGNQTGVTTASICYVGTASNCASLYITVQASSVQGLSFSQNNISVASGQNTTVSLSGGSGSYNITNNSNPAAVSLGLTGNIISVYGVATGSSNVTVCDSSKTCATLYVSVNSTTSTGGVVFGTSNPTVILGQSVNIAISGSSNYFVSANSNTNVVQANISGNALVLYGVALGSSSLTVCGSSGGCNTIYVTVSANGTTTTTTGTTTTTTNASLLTEIQSMQSQLVQLLAAIQTISTRLTQLAASVTPVSGTTTTTGGSTGTSVSDGYKFLNPLAVGSTGTDVIELQKRLTAEGVYSGPINGNYGALTEAAVMQYQTLHGLSPIGIVGPGTRAALNGS